MEHCLRIFSLIFLKMKGEGIGTSVPRFLLINMREEHLHQIGVMDIAYFSPWEHKVKLYVLKPCTQTMQYDDLCRLDDYGEPSDKALIVGIAISPDDFGIYILSEHESLTQDEPNVIQAANQAILENFDRFLNAESIKTPEFSNDFLDYVRKMSTVQKIAALSMVTAKFEDRFYFECGNTFLQKALGRRTLDLTFDRASIKSAQFSLPENAREWLYIQGISNFIRSLGLTHSGWVFDNLFWRAIFDEIPYSEDIYLELKCFDRAHVNGMVREIIQSPVEIIELPKIFQRGHFSKLRYYPDNMLPQVYQKALMLLQAVLPQLSFSITKGRVGHFDLLKGNEVRRLVKIYQSLFNIGFLLKFNTSEEFQYGKYPFYMEAADRYLRE